MADVVYIVKEEERNEELRHSLRSLSENLRHDRVFFAGYKPSWVQNVIHIPVTQVAGQKHPNSLRNQMAAYTHPDVSDTFYLFNDDHFIMQRFERMPILNWGNLNHAIDNCRSLGDSFRKSMVTTRNILMERGLSTINYQLHIPCVIPKDQLVQVFTDFESPAPNGAWLHQVTLAGNIYNWGGESYREDVKVHELYELPSDLSRRDFLSTSDRSFQYGMIGDYIRERFPEKCRYEK